MARADIYTPRFKKQERYSDFDISFDKNPLTGNLAKISDEESIKQALRNLILTSQGERFFNEYFGSTVKNSLFEPIDFMTAEDIKASIRDSIRNFEPRVTLHEVRVTPVEDQNYYAVTLIFSLINIPEELQLNLTIKRVR